MYNTLDDLLNSVPANEKGTPGVFIPEHGDCLFAYLDDAPFRRIYVDSILTVFEALDDNHLVGFQLKGLKALAGDSLKEINVHQNPPIIRLLFESYRLDPDGVEPELRSRTYARVAAAAAKLDPQPN